MRTLDAPFYSTSRIIVASIPCPVRVQNGPRDRVIVEVFGEKDQQEVMLEMDASGSQLAIFRNNGKNTSFFKDANTSSSRNFYSGNTIINSTNVVANNTINATSIHIGDGHVRDGSGNHGRFDQYRSSTEQSYSSASDNQNHKSDFGATEVVIYLPEIEKINSLSFRNTSQVEISLRSSLRKLIMHLSGESRFDVDTKVEEDIILKLSGSSVGKINQIIDKNKESCLSIEGDGCHKIDILGNPFFIKMDLASESSEIKIIPVSQTSSS